MAVSDTTTDGSAAAEMLCGDADEDVSVVSDALSHHSRSSSVLSAHSASSASTVHSIFSSEGSQALSGDSSSAPLVPSFTRANLSSVPPGLYRPDNCRAQIWKHIRLIQDNDNQAWCKACETFLSYKAGQGTSN